jgi:hypothetical protein
MTGDAGRDAIARLAGGLGGRAHVGHAASWSDWMPNLLATMISSPID